MDRARLRLKVNGEDREVLAPIHHSLLEVLREELGLTGTKHGCELGECGTCLVLVDGKPVLSCLTLPVECDGSDVRTVEGMAGPDGLHPLQRAFAEPGRESGDVGLGGAEVQDLAARDGLEGGVRG